MVFRAAETRSWFHGSSSFTCIRADKHWLLYTTPPTRAAFHPTRYAAFPAFCNARRARAPFSGRARAGVRCASASWVYFSRASLITCDGFIILLPCLPHPSMPLPTGYRAEHKHSTYLIFLRSLQPSHIYNITTVLLLPTAPAFALS